MGKGKKNGVSVLSNKEIKHRREQFSIGKGSDEVYESWLNLVDSLKEKALDCLQLTPYEEMRIAIALGDFQNASVLFQGMQSKGGKDAEMAASLFHEIGLHAMQDANFTGAIWYFNQLGTMTPKTQKCSEMHVLGISNLGTCHYQSGKLVEALDMWNKVLLIPEQDQNKSETIKNCVIIVKKNLKVAMDMINNTPHKA